MTEIEKLRTRAEQARDAFRASFRDTATRLQQAKEAYSALNRAESDAERDRIEAATGERPVSWTASITHAPPDIDEAALQLPLVVELLDSELRWPSSFNGKGRDRDKPAVRPRKQAPLWLVRWEDNTLALVRARTEAELADVLDQLADPNVAAWTLYDGPVFLEFSRPGLRKDEEGEHLIGCTPSFPPCDDAFAMKASLVELAFTEGDENLAAGFDSGQIPSRFFRRSFGIGGSHQGAGLLTSADLAARGQRHTVAEFMLGLDAESGQGSSQ